MEVAVPLCLAWLCQVVITFTAGTAVVALVLLAKGWESPIGEGGR